MAFADRSDADQDPSDGPRAAAETPRDDAAAHAQRPMPATVSSPDDDEDDEWSDASDHSVDV